MFLVTLTTDFGVQDHYVSMVKGNILSKKDDIRFVDISHSVETHDIVQAAFYVSNVYDQFPKGTLHLAMVYSYYDTNYKYIIFEKNGHYFLGPDNGLFSLIFDDLDLSKIYEVKYEEGEENRLNNLVSHAIACLAHGLSLEEIGPLLDAAQKKIGIQAVVTKNQIRATIIHIDHFGNVVVNLKKDQFEKMRGGRSFKIYYQQHNPVTRISDSYSSVTLGEVVCFFNSASYLEIAINMGNANDLLNLAKNETIQINFYD